MFDRHEGREHFNLQRRYFGEEANTIRHAAFVCSQNIEHVADQVERTLLHPIAAKDNLLRIDSVRDYQCRRGAVVNLFI